MNLQVIPLNWINICKIQKKKKKQPRFIRMLRSIRINYMGLHKLRMIINIADF